VSVVGDAYITAEVHEGPYLDREADLLIGFSEGYRVSWSTTQGGIRLAEAEDGSTVAGDLFSDNDSYWSGGHVSVSLDIVKGIFFANRPFILPEGGADLLHIAPTVLDLLGVDVPEEMDLAPLELAP